MGKQNVEDIKVDSRGLRGRIVETLQSEASHFEEPEYQLLKFHGTYQQDDRDQRIPRKKAGEEKAWMFMVRSKMPGGRLTSEQYLVHDRMADDLGNGTIRITTRQGIQMHGVLKGGLKDTIARIKDSGLTTWGACGDVVRNTMSPAAPLDTPAHRDTLKLAEELSDRFLARSKAYVEIWLNGEKLEEPVAGGEEPEDPIYGKTYLPRKFKIGIAIPPRNDVDVYSQDIGFVPHLANGGVEGYTILVGGGFGMSHGMVKTHPSLAKPLFYVRRQHAVDAAVAIVTTQRDYGNREDRKQARMKYLIRERGLEWFRQEVESRLDAPTEEPKELHWETVADLLGWHEQGDGKWFCGVWVEEGRIRDSEEKGRWRTAFRTIAERFAPPIALTPNCNIIFCDIRPEDKEAIQEILDQHGVRGESTFSEVRKMGQACVALPTCGLALAESERVFPSVLDAIEPVMRELGIADEKILIRMTGCPNGCARPYNADIGFVGRAPGKYALFIGGSSAGVRLAGLEKKVVTVDEIPEALRPYLADFAKNRKDGETFSDFWGRTRENGPEPDPEQFHVELEERAKKLAEQRAS